LSDALGFSQKGDVMARVAAQGLILLVVVGCAPAPTSAPAVAVVPPRPVAAAECPPGTTMTGLWPTERYSFDEGTLQRGCLRAGDNGRTREGPWTVVDEKGVRVAVLTYQAGRLRRDERWYPSGARKSTRELDGDQPEGAHTEWLESGKKMLEGRFHAGLREGHWTWWNDTGAVEREVDFVGGREKPSAPCPAGTTQKEATNHAEQWCASNDGKRNGPAVEWYEDGAKRQEGEYRNDARHGHWRRWDAKGRLADDGSFVDGQAVGRHREWNEGSLSEIRDYDDHGKLKAVQLACYIWRRPIQRAIYFVAFHLQSAKPGERAAVLARTQQDLDDYVALSYDFRFTDQPRLVVTAVGRSGTQVAGDTWISDDEEPLHMTRHCDEPREK
jgi:antitoxin component YwqK of YwqJK toxin-antitoxin module